MHFVSVTGCIMHTEHEQTQMLRSKGLPVPLAVKKIAVISRSVCKRIRVAALVGCVRGSERATCLGVRACSHIPVRLSPSLFLSACMLRFTFVVALTHGKLEGIIACGGSEPQVLYFDVQLLV